VYKVLVGKPEGKRPLGRPRRRWEDGSGQGPVAGCCECGDEPSGSCATELVSYWKGNSLGTCFSVTKELKQQSRE
jgi:hypothetical protein